MCRVMIKLTKEFECFTLWKLSSVTARDWRHEESKFLFMTKITTNISKFTEFLRHRPLPMMFEIMAWKRLLSNIWVGYHKLWGSKFRQEVMWQNWPFLYFFPKWNAACIIKKSPLCMELASWLTLCLKINKRYAWNKAVMVYHGPKN